MKQTVPDSREKYDRAESVSYVVLIAVSIGLVAYIWLQPWAYFHTADGVSLALFPTVFAVILCVASIIGAVRKAMHRDNSSLSIEDFDLSMRPVVLLTGIVLVSAFGLWRIDPVFNFTALVLVVLLVEGVRDWRLLVGMSVLTGATIYVLFILILNVYFPNVWLS
ncbi:tripartite tricarboxylate transporter TctB family protein [Chloroflexota bacterium]